MERMKLYEKLDYGVGTIGKSLSYGLVSGKILYYCNNVLGLNQTFLTVLFFAGRLWDGLNDLYMGKLIDSTHSRLGKFRPWILTGAVANALVAIALFYKPGRLGDSTLLYVYFSVIYLLTDLTYTMVDVGYWSMIPALSLDTKERDQISMIPRIFGGAAGIVSAFFFPIVDKLGGQEANKGFLMYAILSSVVYIITAVYSGLRVKERVEEPKEQQEEPFSLKQAVSILWHNKQALVIVAIMILFNMANNLSNETTQQYFLHVLPNQGGPLSFYTLILGASQAIGLLGFPFFSKYFGRHRVYIASFLIPVAGYALMFFSDRVAFSSFIPLAISGFVMSAGYGSMGVMQNVMLADAVDFGEYENGQRNEGIIFSMLTFLSKVAAGLSSSITVLGFKMVGFSGSTVNGVPLPASAKAALCIKFLMYMLPPLILLIALWIYLRKFKLKPDFMKEVSTEIQRRRTDVSGVTAFA